MREEQRPTEPRPTRPHPLLGALGGFLFGCFNLMFVLTVQLLGGHGLAKNGVNVWEAAAIYLLGGTAAGGLVGAMLPLLRWRAGAAVVGVVAALPIFTGVGIALDGSPVRWPDGTWFAVAAGAILVGGGIAITNWRFFQDQMANWQKH